MATIIEIVIHVKVINNTQVTRHLHATICHISDVI